MWKLVLINIVFAVAFLVLLIDVYYTTRLFRTPVGNVVTKSEIPLSHQARVFRVHCVHGSYDREKRTLSITLVQDVHADRLVDFIGASTVMCMIDNYLFKLAFVSKNANKITMLASQLDNSPLCFTQLTAYSNAMTPKYAKDLVGATLVLLVYT